MGSKPLQSIAKLITRQAWRQNPRHIGSVSQSLLTRPLSRNKHHRPRHYVRAALGFRGWVSTTISLSAATFTYYYVTDTRSSVHSWLVVPLLRFLYPDAEDAHSAGTSALKWLYRMGAYPRERKGDDASETLQVEVFGKKLSNPFAISGGLDKHGEVVSPLFALGPSIVEIGGVTPLPQDGNDKPRVWRVGSQKGMINRYGLNSKGAAQVARELRIRIKKFAESVGLGIDEDAERAVLDGEAGVPPGSLIPGKLLAVQIAKNKATPDSDLAAVREDYVSCVQQLGKYADIIVVNVSSPNTAGLRKLQQREPLKQILTGVMDAANSVDRNEKPAVMVKVSPDEDSESDIFGICLAVWQTGVDGVIVGNTTKTRPRVSSLDAQHMTESEGKALAETGGYSGPQLLDKTVKLIKRYRETLDEPLDIYKDEKLTRKTIFASGGITSGEDALKVIDAGASIAMVYTALTYGGSGFFSTAKKQMRDTLQDQGQDALAQRAMKAKEAKS
ncbi:MAG: Dihydroorotate dehydrogenase (quinone), mitochondrial [Chrysothrix sp. TS-e1954]|nr:MAG: Dihydroorotate dehydrogenase (quinone), mitochondrial [Chrysothrix sp. TS-e1954]